MLEAVASRGHERALTVHGRRVPIFEGGAGRPLLYLHGAGTYWWRPVHDLLAAHRRILLPVHPGFGANRLGAVEVGLVPWDDRPGAHYPFRRG